MRFVISLGGSVIIPDDVDIKFLRGFANLIRKSKHKIHIVTGGGKFARIYVNVAREIGLDIVKQDILGINISGRCK